MDDVRPAHSPLVLREDDAPPLILFDELAFEILSWLPVKSLVRFKCVCKDWKSFISNPNFIKEHLQKSPKNSDLILTSEGKKYVHYSCSVLSSLKNPSSTIITKDLSNCLDLEKNYRVIGSCNGLVCLVVGKYRRVNCKEICVRFWNPATRLISELVYLQSHSKSYPLLGFGYDNLNDTYKVVAIPLSEDEGDDEDEDEDETEEDAEVKVYSLDDKCWRNIQNFPFAAEIVTDDNGVYLNGTLNWLVNDPFKSNLSDNLLSLFIVSLDLGIETYTQLLPPCGLIEFSDLCIERILGVLMDCLCFSHDYKRTHFVVWQMKEFGVQKSWTQLLNLSYQDIPNLSYQDIPVDIVKFAALSPLFMYKNADELIMMASWNHGTLQAILYNPRDNRVEPIETTNNIMWIDAVDYVQSLVSPS